MMINTAWISFDPTNAKAFGTTWDYMVKQQHWLQTTEGRFW
jgi:hypothetical protein